MADSICDVVYADGTPCRRPVRVWCDTCYRWSWAHDGADPNGRQRRGRPVGEVLEILKAAASSNTDECIILSGYKRRPTAAYGGKAMNASRVVWIMAYGDPGSLHVLHTCHRGEQGCVNIRHLYLGDDAQNRHDTVEAGHLPRGSENHASKLTESDVCEIRARYRPGRPYHAGNADELAGRFGVTVHAIRDVVYRRAWAWLDRS